MNFNGRRQLVTSVQGMIGVTQDGIAGPITWRGIASRLGSNTSPDIRQTIRNVQRHLQITSDGVDGPQTWNAIVRALSQKPHKQPPVVSPSSSNFKETVQLTPQTNGPNSQIITPQCIVLHHTSGSYLGSIDWTGRVINPNTGKRLYASYHVIIARDGRRTVTNMPNNRAYHAGASTFKGRSSLNSWSLGVAWEGDTYKIPLSDQAIDSAIEYMLPQMKRWNIGIDWVTDHRTVSPGRKSDIAPGEFTKFINRLRSRIS